MDNTGITFEFRMFKGTYQNEAIFSRKWLSIIAVNISFLHFHMNLTTKISKMSSTTVQLAERITANLLSTTMRWQRTESNYFARWQQALRSDS